MSHQVPVAEQVTSTSGESIVCSISSEDTAILIPCAKTEASSGCCAQSRSPAFAAEQPRSDQMSAVKSPSQEKSLEELGLFSLAK